MRRAPARRGRLARISVARHRGNHDIEGIGSVAAMGRRVHQRVDDLQLLDDRAGPAVRDDDRQRIRVLRLNVDEVNVQPVDLGDEIRQGIEARLDLAPVVLRRPIARERLHGRELHALRCVGDRFAFGPDGRLDAPAQLPELGFRNIDAKRTNGGCAAVNRLCYCVHRCAPARQTYDPGGSEQAVQGLRSTRWCRPVRWYRRRPTGRPPPI